MTETCVHGALIISLLSLIDSLTFSRDTPPDVQAFLSDLQQFETGPALLVTLQTVFYSTVSKENSRETKMNHQNESKYTDIY